MTSDAKQASGNASFAMDVHGTLALHVLSHEGASVRFAATLDDARMTLGGLEDPEGGRVAESMRKPVSFELQAGKVVASAFAPEASGVTISLWRTLFAALQLAAAPGGTSWAAEEWDSAGRYRARYRREASGAVVRTKEAYVTVLKPPSAKLPEALVPRIEQSETRYAVESGALAKVEEHDLVVTRFDERSSLSVETKVELQLRREIQPRRPDQAAVAAAVPLAPDQPAPTASRRSVTTELDKIRMAGQSFAEVVSRLEAQAREEQDGKDGSKGGAGEESSGHESASGDVLRQRTAAFSTALAFLRSGEGTIDVALAKIRAGSSATDSLVSALAAAETPASEAAVIGLVHDTKLQPRIRMRAMWGLARREHPSEAAARALEAHLSEAAVSEQALLGLGSLARRFRDVGQLDAAKALAAPLERALEAAQTRDAKAEALHAISNAGDPALLPRVEPLLATAEPRVRAAAVEALRHMKVPSIDGLIAARLTGDDDAGVQLASMRAARTRGASPELASALAKLLATGKTPNVRHRAVELASDWSAKYPELGKALQRAATSDPDKQVRTAASAALTARPAGGS